MTIIMEGPIESPTHYLDTISGYESWSEYDSHNNLIHLKDSDGQVASYSYEYDERGNIIKYASFNNGYCEEQYEFGYDENNRQIWRNDGINQYQKDNNDVWHRIVD